MKILLVHNYYQQGGGEDEVFHREKKLLLDAGHEIIEYTRHNDEINQYSFIETASLAARTIWAWDSHSDLRQLLKTGRPDVAHFHNTFPLISPSAYYACAAAGVPVVQTLHNSRLVCPAGTLFRNGEPCDDCVGRSFAWPAVRHGCYHGSHARSLLTASALLTHRWLGTWDFRVDKYVVFSNFYRQMFIAAGIASDKIVVKPHFVECDPGTRQGAGEYALFVGRLAPEKGVRTLLKAWHGLQEIPLKIRGEGPLGDIVLSAANAEASPITVVPRPSRRELFKLMKGARFLIWPSEGYNETFGLVAIEAFACGVPVLASNVGAMKEIVQDRKTGLHFRPGDPSDLAEKVEWAWTHPSELEDMGKAARAEFQTKYTREPNYVALMEIYGSVLREKLRVPGVLAHAVSE
jgi:glycosyltransferase involved in cell wall biosynthesis